MNDRTGLTFFVDATAGTFGMLITDTSFAQTTVADQSGVALQKEVFYHLAAVRLGQTFYLYKNGTRVATQSVIGSCQISSNTTGLYIGGQFTTVAAGVNGANGPAFRLNGYLDEVRYTNGVARYPESFTPSQIGSSAVAVDQLYESVRFLIHGNTLVEGSTAIVDTGPQKLQVTPVNAYMTTAQSSRAGSSIYFNGYTAYMTVGGATEAATFWAPTQDWTFECSLKWAGGAGVMGLCGAHGGSSGGTIYCGFTGGRLGSLNIELCSPTAPGRFYASASIGTYPQWNSIVAPAGGFDDVAVTKSGRTYQFFVNGYLVGTTADIGAVTTPQNTPLYVGATDPSWYPYFFSGWIDEIRLTYGTRRYTTDYIPQVGQFPEGNGDPHWAYVAVLVAGTGSNAAPTDLGPANRTATPVSTPAVYSTAVKKFRSGSFYFDGQAGGLGLQTNFVVPGGLGQDDWTIECWMYHQNSNSLLFSSETGGGVGLSIMSGGYVQSGGTQVMASLGTVPDTYRWIHVAYTFSEGVIRRFYDGVLNGTATTGYVNLSGGIFSVGGWPNSNSSFYGHLDDFRITVGIARYVANYTVPYGPLPLRAGSGAAAAGDAYFDSVRLLLTGDDAVGDTTPSDSSSYGLYVGPFGTTATVSDVQKKWGSGSLYFNGAGRFQTADTDLAWGADDWTIECWAYPTFFAGLTNTLACQWGNGKPRNWILKLNSNGASLFITTSGNGFTDIFSASVSGVVQLNQWHHVAAVRSGNSVVVYLNGQPGAALNYNTLVSSSVSPITLGGNPEGEPNNWNHFGYIDDLRITVGVARYIESFTPPIDAHPTQLGVAQSTFMYEGQLTPTRRAIVPPTEHFIGQEFVSPVVGFNDGRQFGYASPYGHTTEWNGPGVVRGTIKEKGLTVDFNLHRKVYIMVLGGVETIAETWSDPATGEFEFHGLKLGLTYLISSYDHTGTYRAIIADAQAV